MTAFWRGGPMRLWVADTIANRSAPTVAELDSDITTSVWVLEGWEVDETVVAVQQWDDRAARRHRGYLTHGDPVLTLTEDDTSNPLRVTFARGAETHLVLFPLGLAGGSPAPGDLCEVRRVRSRGPNRVIDREDIAKWRVAFGPIADPVLDAVVA